MKQGEYDDILGKFEKFNQQYQAGKVRPADFRDMGAAVLDAYDKKKELVCRKPFKANGRAFKMGEIIDNPNELQHRLAALGANGFVCPRSTWDRGGEHEARQYRMEILQPEVNNLRHLADDKARKEKELDGLRAAVRHCQTEIENLEGQIDGQYNVVLDILNGKEIVLPEAPALKKIESAKDLGGEIELVDIGEVIAFAKQQ